jgi:predicted transposase YbfD/YdcC
MKRPLPPAVSFAFEVFADVEDPRIARTRLHPLMNVLVMALCGALAGANGWDELADFAESRLGWFKTVLDVPHGTPSADTFRRVFEVLDPRQLEAAMQGWIAKVSESFADQVVAIDGKSLRGAITEAGSKTPLHLLHAWAVEQHLLLAQQRVEGAPGEVGGIPELLKRMKIPGATVTTDANGCTRAVTEAVRDARADFALALKGNRGPIHARISSLFVEAERRKFRGLPVHRSSDKAHGRLERRTVRAMTLPADAVPDGWRDVRTAVMIDRTRQISGETSTERHFYVSSLPADGIEKLARVIRSHWGIENSLHWLLDVAFDEDSRRIRDETSAENYALVARLALMLLKRSPDRKSINLKRKRVAWQEDYLGYVLAGRAGA